jgi:hypothetical protein
LNPWQESASGSAPIQHGHGAWQEQDSNSEPSIRYGLFISGSSVAYAVARLRKAGVSVASPSQSPRDPSTASSIETRTFLASRSSRSCEATVEENTKSCLPSGA